VEVGPTGDGARPTRQPAPEATVIVVVGAAGEATAEMLRREGYSGPITMLSDDDAPPCDRPNLSKDYLTGNAPEEWIPLRPPEFYDEHRIGDGARARQTEAQTPRDQVRS
jgi:NADPH-dependent 2,4-dienoyl-CoA reductase/sulfur reductase-like enzyme